MAKLLTRLKIDRVAAVDRGAGEGVKVLLVKRIDEGHAPNDAEIDAYLKRNIFTEAEAVAKRQFSEQERQTLAASGHALPDGSYPVENEQDLRNAIHAYGRGNNKPAVKAHIMRRARSLGRADLIPDKWKVSKSAITPITKFLAWVGIAKDAIDFDEAQANAEAAEYGQGMIEELDEATDSLRQAICSIMCDDTVADKQKAIDDSIAQYQAHVQGVVPEGLENAMAAAGLLAAGYTATPGGALTKGEREMADKTAAELEAEKKKETERAEKAEKRFQAVIKMSGAHSAYMNHEDATMPDGGKEAFTDMSAEERDKHIEKHPLSEAKEKRLAKLDPETRAILKRADDDHVALVALQKKDEMATFTKRAIEIGLAETQGEILYKAHHSDVAAVVELENLLKAQAEQIAKGALFGEFGSRQQTPSGVAGEIDAVVKDLQKADPKLTHDQCVAKIAELPQHRELWKRYRAEDNGTRQAA